MLSSSLVSLVLRTVSPPEELIYEVHPRLAQRPISRVILHPAKWTIRINHVTCAPQPRKEPGLTQWIADEVDGRHPDP